MQESGTGNTRHASQTWAIYYEVEVAVAEQMAKAGDIELLPSPQVPESLKVNNVGDPALCAVIIPGDKLSKFHSLLALAYRE